MAGFVLRQELSDKRAALFSFKTYLKQKNAK